MDRSSEESILNAARRHIITFPAGSIVVLDKHCFINSNGEFRYDIINFVQSIRRRYTILVITNEIFQNEFFQVSGLRPANVVLRTPGFSDSVFLKEFVTRLNDNRKVFACTIITNPAYCLVGANFIIHT